MTYHNTQRLLGYVDEAGVVLPQYRKPKSMELAAKLKKVYPDLGMNSQHSSFKCSLDPLA